MESCCDCSNRNPFLKKTSKRARVELLPLIDIMFLLVAFFMVISISMVFQKGISVDLSPSTTSDSDMQEEKDLYVSIDSVGNIYLNKESVTNEELLNKLKEEAFKNKETSVIINADKNSRHENVIKALDLIVSSKLHNIIFTVKPTE